MKNNLFKKATAIFLSTVMLIPTQPIITFADGESVCEKYYFCENCGYTKTEEVPKKEHTQYVAEEAVEATCEEPGWTALIKCSVCDEVLQEKEEIPAGHKEVIDEAVKATCTTAGKTEGSHCEVCQTVIKAQELIPDMLR